MILLGNILKLAGENRRKVVEDVCARHVNYKKSSVWKYTLVSRRAEWGETCDRGSSELIASIYEQ